MNEVGKPILQTDKEMGQEPVAVKLNLPRLRESSLRKKQFVGWEPIQNWSVRG